MNLLEGLWNREVLGPNRTVSDSTDLEWCLGIRLSTSSWEMLPLLVQRPLAGNHRPAPRDTAGFTEPASVIWQEADTEEGTGCRSCDIWQWEAGTVSWGAVQHPSVSPLPLDDQPVPANPGGLEEGGGRSDGMGGGLRFFPLGGPRPGPCEAGGQATVAT